MPQNLLKVKVDKLRFHDERKAAMKHRVVDPYWLNAYTVGYSAKLEIHRLWNVQYHERLLSEGREANTKKI